MHPSPGEFTILSSYYPHRTLKEAFVGDKDHALEWLEKAFQEKSEEMTVLRIRRCYDFLRSDPRYKDLERRVGYTW